VLRCPSSLVVCIGSSAAAILHLSSRHAGNTCICPYATWSQRPFPFVRGELIDLSPMPTIRACIMHGDALTRRISGAALFVHSWRSLIETVASDVIGLSCTSYHQLQLQSAPSRRRAWALRLGSDIRRGRRTPVTARLTWDSLSCFVVLARPAHSVPDTHSWHSSRCICSPGPKTAELFSAAWA
jgi:hypothetical protein